MRETLVKSEEFKDLPLGKIPKNWQVDKLVARASVFGGKRLPLGHFYSDTPTEFRYLRVLDFFERDIEFEALEFLKPSTFKALERYEIYNDNLFISIAGSLGYVGVFRPPHQQRTILTENAARIVIQDDSVPEFLAYQMNSSVVQKQIEAEKGTGGGVPKLALFRIENLLLVFPPREEQEKIVAILETFDKAIAHTSSLIAKLKQMKAGLLHDLLTRGLDENGELRDAIAHPQQFKESPLGQIPKDWEVLKLESLLNGRPKNGYSPKEVNEWTGTLMLGLGCLTEEGFEPLQLKNAPSSDLKIRAALLNDGDFLLSRSNTRERVALSGIYRYVGVPCIYSDLMMRLSLNEKTCNRFLELLLRHFPVRRQLTGNAQGTSVSMVKISSQTVIETVVALPNPTEQARIIECVDTYDTRIRAEEAYHEKLKLQKQGLIHDLLTGKVRVKNA